MERNLTADERVVLNAEVHATISETVRTVRFGEVLAALGVTTVTLDDEGRLTRFHRDGSGKSTLVERVIAKRRPGVAFVNADVITAGYSVALHVLLIPEGLAVHRVEYLVAADTPHVYDNSQVHGPRNIASFASFASGFPDGPFHWPAWTPSALASGWPTKT